MSRRPGGGGGEGGGPRSSSSSKTPAGAQLILSDGTELTKTQENISTTTPDYNVVQVTSGTLNLIGCTINKQGDFSSNYSADATSFYGTNSAVYASGSEACINIDGGSITTVARGSNAVFATNNATINVNDLVIDNTSSVSRGLHCTGGGTINARNVNITTRSETSSTVATDRGGGTVTVTGGNITARGSKSAIMYSTGHITVDSITGLSEKGPMATVEGSNLVTIKNSNLTSSSSTRGILLHQSTSGDAQGSNPVCTISRSTLTTTSPDAPLCFVTNVAGTLTLTDVTLNVQSGILMSVEYYKRGTNSTGTLILDTTGKEWTYTGQIKADDQNNVCINVKPGVTWNGAANTAGTARSSSVTIQKGAVWNLTAPTHLTALDNNGTINTAGFELTYDTITGAGTIRTSAK